MSPSGCRPAGRVVPELGSAGRVIPVVFGCRPDDVARDVILTPFVPLGAFRRRLDEVLVELSPPFFYKGFTGAIGGRRLTVIATGVGPARVGDCVGLLSLTPARRVLFAGAVGGLAATHAIGDFFCPLACADGEGYTRYVERPFRELVAEASMIPRPSGFGEDVPAFLKRRGWAVHEGRVFTVGCITFESRENLEVIREAGFDALEMELSAFYAAARRHGLEAAVLTYVSDLPLGSSLWEEKSPEERDALRLAYRALPALAMDYLRSTDPDHLLEERTRAQSTGGASGRGPEGLGES